jgi:hypothetical protein
MNYEVTHRSLSPKPILSSIKMKNSSTTSLQLIRSSLSPSAAPGCSSSHGHACHPAVIYMLTEFAGCSVGRGINRGACKLARTPRRSKKKKYASMHVTSCSSGGSKASWILTRTVFITS